MEELFHKRVQHIIKNKENRSKIYNFLKKEFINEKELKSEQYKKLKFIIFELLVEWTQRPKLDDLFVTIKTKNLLYQHDSYKNIARCLHEEYDFIENPPSVEEGVIECKRCKSNRTISFNKQTRSGDEATSVFIKCTNCNLQFKI